VRASWPARRAVVLAWDIEFRRGGTRMAKRDRGSASEGWRIWRESDEPFLKKVGLSFKNQFIKIRTLKDCCGNYGEPGC